MALKRRIKKLSKSEAARVSGRTYLVCSECGNEEVEVPSDVGRVTCAKCVQKMIAPPANYKKEKSDKPRGWHFKEYFEHNGVVYSKGVEVTDPDEIKALKKTQKTLKPKIAKTTKTAKKVAKKKVVAKKTPTKTATKKKVVKKKTIKRARTYDRVKR